MYTRPARFCGEMMRRTLAITSRTYYTGNWYSFSRSNEPQITRVYSRSRNRTRDRCAETVRRLDEWTIRRRWSVPDCERSRRTSGGFSFRPEQPRKSVVTVRSFKTRPVRVISGPIGRQFVDWATHTHTFASSPCTYFQAYPCARTCVNVSVCARVRMHVQDNAETQVQRVHENVNEGWKEKQIEHPLSIG